jgi:hypothetical protein
VSKAKESWYMKLEKYGSDNTLFIENRDNIEIVFSEEKIKLTNLKNNINMKKLFLIGLIVVSSFALNAQTVNDIPIKDIDVEYVQIVGTSKLFSTKLTIQIDFGQRTRFFSSGKETIVKDEEGKALEFNSMIDALNFMSKNGFEFVNAYAISIGNQNVYHYILRNKKSKPKE